MHPEETHGSVTSWLVRTVWLVMTAAALAAVIRYGPNMPYSDEWLNVPQLVGEEPITIPWLLAPASEHRFPLSRLVYVVVLRAAGLDFRGGMVFIVLVLALASLVLIRTSRRVRGRPSLADAFFPLCLLGLGQYANLFWSMQILFALPACLFCLAMAFIARRRPTAGTLAGVGACAVLLTLSDVSGVLLAVPLAAWLGWVGVRETRGALRARALTAAVAVAVLVLLTLAGWHRHPDVPPHEWGSAAPAALEVLSGAFGPAGWVHHRLWAVAILALCASSLARVRAVLRTGRERDRALGLAACLAAVVLLAAGIGYGRGMYGPGTGLSSLYVTLMAPLPCALHLIFTLYGGRVGGRLVPGLLTVAVLLVTPYNAAQGLDHAQARHHAYERFDADVRAGLVLEALAARHGQAIYDDDARRVPECIRLLHRHRLGPYRTWRGELETEKRPYAEHPVTLPTVYVHDMEWDGTSGRSTGRDPYVVFRFDKPRTVRSVRLRFTLTTPHGRRAWLFLRWAHTGTPRADFRESERAAPLWISPQPGEQTLTVQVYDTVDRLRVDPCSGACTFALHGTTLLTEP